MQDAGRDENCPKCGVTGKRIFSPPYLNKVQMSVFMPQYVPSLGKAFNSKREMTYHVEKHGMVEVGNDFSNGNRMQDSFEKDRADKRAARWRKADEEIA